MHFLIDQNEVDDDCWQRQRRQPSQQQSEKDGIGAARENDDKYGDGAQDYKDAVEMLIKFYGANPDRGEVFGCIA